MIFVSPCGMRGLIFIIVKYMCIFPCLLEKYAIILYNKIVYHLKNKPTLIISIQI